MNKVRHEFRQIFFEMGFEEMPTNRYVETGFWNFDALFVPQQHPARDLQDTFYISDPPLADKPRADPPSSTTSTASQKPINHNAPSDPAPSQPSAPLDYESYWDSVRTVHESGKYGSIGYRYPWSPSESLRLVLRTHTTSISTYMLHKLAANPRPARYFSIDRVFRNESVDATHLAEFHQVEGVIADFGLTLGGLIGFMETFFAKMGVRGLRFKPAYNPYTEPSMEIFGWHAGLAKWVEIGNSGMFRPEMLEPMGLPPDMRVYGWGLSLERPTMIKCVCLFFIALQPWRCVVQDKANVCVGQVRCEEHPRAAGPQGRSELRREQSGGQAGEGLSGVDFAYIDQMRFMWGLHLPARRFRAASGFSLAA